MISARAVSKRFGKLPVLNGLDLDVERGSITAIVGPNASGKTTFNRIVLGLVRPDGGEIRIFDGTTALNGDASYRGQIGYSSQIARYPENLSGRDVMSLVSDVRSGGHSVRDNELVQLFNLGDRSTVSACCPAGHAGSTPRSSADLLILDEPTAGLDPVSAGILKDNGGEREAGRTIIVTSHVLSELDELADGIAFLLDGVVRFQWFAPRTVERHGRAAPALWRIGRLRAMSTILKAVRYELRNVIRNRWADRLRALFLLQMTGAAASPGGEHTTRDPEPPQRGGAAHPACDDRSERSTGSGIAGIHRVAARAASATRLAVGLFAGLVLPLAAWACRFPSWRIAE